MKLKFLLVMACLLLEVGYAGRMAFDSNDPELVEAILKVPVLGDMMYEYRVKETREQAEKGDVHEMMALYFKSGSMNRAVDLKHAKNLLRNSGSPSAELFLFLQEGGIVDQNSPREFMLLVARAMQENIRPYVSGGNPNNAYIQQSRQYAMAFETLLTQAVAGNPDAVWVMEKLGMTGDVSKASSSRP